MSTVSSPANSSATHELNHLRNQWWCFLLLGTALVVFGSICIAEPLIPSLASVVFLGFLLMAAGITQIVSSFWAGKWSGMLIHMLIGVLYVVVGYMIVDAPVINMVLITKFIAIFLIVSGDVSHHFGAGPAVPGLGLGTAQRRHHPAVGHCHQSPIAGSCSVGYRPVYRHRNDL